MMAMTTQSRSLRKYKQVSLTVHGVINKALYFTLLNYVAVGTVAGWEINVDTLTVGYWKRAHWQ